MTEIWSNWTGNIQSKPIQIYTPETEEEVITLVKKAAREGVRVKVTGSGHSCSRIAASDNAWLISLDKLNQLISIDHQTGHVTVQAGIRLYELNQLLADNGLALSNLGTIDEQSIAGAISTGTHGTGIDRGSLSSMVAGLHLVTASGELIEASPQHNASLYQAACVGLGSLGIITRVTLACVPAFKMNVREWPDTLENTLAKLDERLKLDRFCFWWFPHTDQVAVRTAETTNEALTIKPRLRCWMDKFKNIMILNRLHETAMLAAAKKPTLIPHINRIFQRRFYAASKSEIVSSKDGFRLTILVKQHVMEYALPVSRTAEAVRGLKKLIEDKAYKVHHPIEVRFGASDNAWLSLAHGRETCYIGVIMYRPFGQHVPYEDYFRDVDQLFYKLGGRPHWAKIHYRSAEELRKLYPQWDEFMAMRSKLDPSGMFLNDYLERVLTFEHNDEDKDAVPKSAERDYFLAGQG